MRSELLEKCSSSIISAYSMHHIFICHGKRVVWECQIIVYDKEAAEAFAGRGVLLSEDNYV